MFFILFFIAIVSYIYRQYVYAMTEYFANGTHDRDAMLVKALNNCIEANSWSGLIFGLSDLFHTCIFCIYASSLHQEIMNDGFIWIIPFCITPLSSFRKAWEYLDGGVIDMP
jgi:hypothetical protein